MAALPDFLGQALPLAIALQLPRESFKRTTITPDRALSEKSIRYTAQPRRASPALGHL